MQEDLSKILKEKTNAKIIWYLRESNRKYSEILKHLNERDSGKINYHIKQLKNQGLIKNDKGFYCLTKKGMQFALYVNLLQLKEKYPIPVVLVTILQNKKILLAKRSRMPCKDHWGLPGNEILYAESPIIAAKKEIKTELGFDTFNEKIFGSYPTIYKESGEIIFHVMLFVIKASIKKIPISGKAKGKISEYKFFSKEAIKKLKLIPSNILPIKDSFSITKKIKIQNIDI
jgi:ADP-ribose pyrophosphatase YjhB (NUDIX family)/predicted transcriptional regulator